jgi:MOSC domain-containing protein YiiM
MNASVDPQSIRHSAVLAIHVAPQEGAATEAREDVRAVAGWGLEGDRYYAPRDAKGQRPKGSDVTLIEAESIDAVRRDYQLELEVGETRRNIVTRGVPLNHLVGRTFKAGTAKLEGVRLCEPCGYLEKLTRPGVRAALIHRGGLRARIVESGTIRVGDSIVWDRPR